MKHARVGEIYDDQNWLLYDGEVRVSFTKEGARDDAATALTRSKHAERQKKEQAEHKNREKKLAEASKNERLAGPWFPPWLQKSGKAKGVICEVYVLHQDESMKSVGTEQRSYPGDDKSHHAERKWWNLYGNTLCGSIRSGTVRKVCFILGDTPCDSSNVKGCHEWFKETVLPALTKAGLKEADVTIFTTKDSTPNFRFDGGALVLL
ncbi:MAG TPA: hypothetical protein VFI24_20860 [Pyrinomonadaceae bacterium]|nr:hypothetical protein [Pyrinomonadaceae bacterium]